MKLKVWISLFLIVLVAVTLIFYPKDFWEDEQRVAEMVDSIVEVGAKNLSQEQINFIKEYPQHKALVPIHMWILIKTLRTVRQDDYLALAQMYQQYNFPRHIAFNFRELATEGRSLYEVKSYLLSAQYFVGAFNLAQDEASKEEMGDLAFFAAYSYKYAGQKDKAIEWYKKSINSNLKDYRPHSELGLIYFERAQASLKTSQPDRLSMSLASKYIRQSLNLNKDQPQLKKMLMELSQMNLDMLRQLNNRPNQNSNRFNKFPEGVNIPNPVPQINIPKPPVPSPNSPKSFKQR